jgi:hypothetical protein
VHWFQNARLKVEYKCRPHHGGAGVSRGVHVAKHLVRVTKSRTESRVQDAVRNVEQLES